MEYEKIIQIINTIDKSSLSKFAYKQGDIELIIEKNNLNTNITESLKIDNKKDNIDKISKSNDNVEYIKSPLVGTYYASPSPDEKNYIQVGDKISKGQVVGIIEAMKVMNEVTSEFDGIVEEILINNNDTVEYAQPLVKISIS